MSAVKTGLTFALGTACGLFLANNCRFSDAMKRRRDHCPLNARRQHMEEAKPKEELGNNTPNTSNNSQKMGIIGGGLMFSMGTIWGIYLAQSYNIPDVKKFADEFLSKAKHIEESHRKFSRV